MGDDYKTRDGTGDRDYVHVMDLAEGHVKAVDHILGDGKEGVHIFNLGTGTGATVLEVIAAFSEACGKKIPHVIAPRRKEEVWGKCVETCGTGKRRTRKDFRENNDLKKN